MYNIIKTSNLPLGSYSFVLGSYHARVVLALGCPFPTNSDLEHIGANGIT
jgi:hypothetical protein